MGSLFASLTPFALGTLVSPLAIVAMIAILLSHRPGRNGVAFLAGWTLAVLVILLVTVAIAGSLTVHRPSDPPKWVAIVHLVIGAVLVLSAIWVIDRGHARVREMAAARAPGDIVAAAPQLPGWLKSVEHFQPGRCVALGFGLCALNPVDLSCVVGAGLELRLADASSPGKVLAGVLFVVISILPAAIPFTVYAVKGAAAAPTLTRLRSWIAGHNGWLTAGMLGVIGILQLVKGFQQI